MCVLYLYIYIYLYPSGPKASGPKASGPKPSGPNPSGLDGPDPSLSVKDNLDFGYNKPYLKRENATNARPFGQSQFFIILVTKPYLKHGNATDARKPYLQQF